MKALDNLIDRTERKLQQCRESNPYEDRISGSFTFGNCIITFSLSKDHKEIDVWNPVKNTYLDCISEHLKASTPDFLDIEFEAEESDVWDNHGFRDAADYYRYRL